MIAAVTQSRVLLAVIWKSALKGLCHCDFATLWSKLR